MTSRWAGLVVCLFIGFAGMSLYSAGCDPCHSCSTKNHHHKKPTPTADACSECMLAVEFLGVLVQGKNATVYAPQGNWGGGSAALKLYRLKPARYRHRWCPVSSCDWAAFRIPALPTPNTGETVCVGNNTDVFLINGTTLSSTVTSSATSTQNFSGGTCENCGVVVDSTTNKALITIGLASGGPGGYQFLDLGGTPTFESPIPAGTATSEDVSIDPIRHLILSPNEASIYQTGQYHHLDGGALQQCR